MKILSLFSGIGGFDLAFRNKGHTIIGACEIDKYARSVYSRHFPGVRIYQDATKINPEDLEDFDCLCAGFPCQAFSIAGKRGGFEDKRGILFYEIIRIAKEKKPRYLLLENVKGLMSHDKGNTIQKIIKELNIIGYIVEYEIYNSKYFVPQNRERVFLKCTRLTEIMRDGQEQKFHTSKKIIRNYLFQKLLSNLNEVKRLQGANSKDLVVDWLLCIETGNGAKRKTGLLSVQSAKGYPKSEISFQIGLLDQFMPADSGLAGTKKNIVDFIMTVVEEKSYTSDTVFPLPNTALWLKKSLAEAFPKMKSYTMLTLTKEITGLKIYTSLQIEVIMRLLIIQLIVSSPDSWKEILSDLTIMREGTNYVRFKEDNGAIRTESGNRYRSDSVFTMRKCIFIIGHLRKESRPEIFPIRENIEGNNSSRHKTQKDGSRIQDKLVGAIDANYHKGGGTRTMIGWSKSTRDWGVEQRFKIGEANTLNTGEGCRNQSTCNYVIQKSRVRRLTPLECERLQGFPDNYTKGLSDNQRYKCLGNAVTVPVIEYIVERLDSEIFVESTEKMQ